MPWDTGLDKNSAAYKFVEDTSRVIRVVAGPGTGKSFGLQELGLCEAVINMAQNG